MTGRSHHNSFQFTTTVQPPTGGYMYTFGNNSETEYSEEDGETFELRSRGKERHRRSTSTDRKDDIVYLIRDIKEGDTLISISLQYFCTVADIKRANNLLTEQDFFALRSIRIPVKKFSSFTETHNTTSHKTSSPGGTHRIAEIPIPGASLDSSSSSSSADSVECFLQEKDKDIELVKSSAPSRSNLSEVVSSLEQPLLGDPDRRPFQKKDPYYGADWGMRWWTAVAIMLVVGIVTPVFYLLYYEVLMKADVSHHTTIDSVRPGPTQPAVAEPLVLPQASAGSYPDSHVQPVRKHDTET
ncbi:lysM and putative peptidoglycan-binding domain-containing protein 3 [Paramisgurnus dabryanus]|uniref:lysM and putative peptidoglycan-binding domain-containing protein 3 n=1 Tax=Paramisgurnus dabryanus TaxID=90735 RepID=UPI0031F4655E